MITVFALFLFFCKRMISCALFANVIFAVFGQILSDIRARICTVGVHGLVSIFKQFGTAVAVMKRSVGHCIVGYQLAVSIAFDMIFVAEVGLVILF